MSALPRRLPWLTLFVCAALLGCAGLGRRHREVPQAERQQYDAAVALLPAQPAKAEAALRAFLAAHPDSDLVGEASLELARLDHKSGRDDQAITDLRWLVENHPEADAADQARLWLAQILNSRGDTAGAWEVAKDIQSDRLPSAERPAAHRLLADLAGAAGDNVARVHWLAQVLADQHDPQAAARVELEIKAALAGLSDADLEQLAGELGEQPPAGMVRLEQAERALRAGNVDAAKRALDQAAKLPLSKQGANQLATLRARLVHGAGVAEALARLPSYAEARELTTPDVSGATGTLGVVLPLTGPAAPFGMETLQGILLAAGLYDPDRTAPSAVALEVRDSGAGPDQAAQAVRELAADPKVVAIIGPLLTAESESAGQAAEQAGVPLLTLTRHADLGAGRRFVLRMGSTPSQEVALLADYACRVLGLRRFAILYPDDAYGHALRADFWDAVEARGGKVVGVARYPDDATDFGDAIRSLIGYDLLPPEVEARLTQRDHMRDRAKRLPPEKAAELRAQAAALTAPDGSPLPPFVDFDALFIPDSAEKAGLIAPQLAFHLVRGVRLFGPSDWNDPVLLRIGGKHVDGAIFTARFYAQSNLPSVLDFTRRFSAAFGREPTFLAAQSYDAARLVMAQRVAGAQTREEVLGGLLAVGVWPGVSGVMTMGPDGGAIKRPYLLGVDHGHVVSIDETGQPPALRVPEPGDDAGSANAAAQVGH